MAARRRVGDIYEIVDGSLIGLLQHVSTDASVPGSNVVNVLAPVPTDWGASFKLLPVLFRAHVFLRAGETLDLWRKAGCQDLPDQTRQRWCTVPAQDLGNPTSANWRVWMTGEPMTPARTSADLLGAELGYVMSPIQIVHRIRHGRYTHDLPAVLDSPKSKGLFRRLVGGQDSVQP